MAINLNGGMSTSRRAARNLVGSLPLILETSSSRGGGTRTHNVRILSPDRYFLLGSNLLDNEAHLSQKHRFTPHTYSVLFGSVVSLLLPSSSMGSNSVA